MQAIKWALGTVGIGLMCLASCCEDLIKLYALGSIGTVLVLSAFCVRRLQVIRRRRDIKNTAGRAGTRSDGKR